MEKFESKLWLVTYVDRGEEHRDIVLAHDGWEAFEAMKKLRPSIQPPRYRALSCPYTPPSPPSTACDTCVSLA